MKPVEPLSPGKLATRDWRREIGDARLATRDWQQNSHLNRQAQIHKSRCFYTRDPKPSMVFHQIFHQIRSCRSLIVFEIWFYKDVAPAALFWKTQSQ
jgi:hypothetical protein